MRSYMKTKLWAKDVNYFDVFDKLWSSVTEANYIITIRDFSGCLFIENSLSNLSKENLYNNPL